MAHIFAIGINLKRRREREEEIFYDVQCVKAALVSMSVQRVKQQR